MRTTIDIDDDVLNAAKALARRENVSAGHVVSRILRDALTGRATPPPDELAPSVAGFRAFAPRGKLVSNEDIDRLRDEEGI